MTYTSTITPSRCYPTCSCCKEKIEYGEFYQLSNIYGTDNFCTDCIKTEYIDEDTNKTCDICGDSINSTSLNEGDYEYYVSKDKCICEGCISKSDADRYAEDNCYGGYADYYDV